MDRAESEFVVPPGCCWRVESKCDAGHGLTIVQLTELPHKRMLTFKPSGALFPAPPAPAERRTTSISPWALPAGFRPPRQPPPLSLPPTTPPNGIPPPGPSHYAPPIPHLGGGGAAAVAPSSLPPPFFASRVMGIDM